MEQGRDGGELELAARDEEGELLGLGLGLRFVGTRHDGRAQGVVGREDAVVQDGMGPGRRNECTQPSEKGVGGHLGVGGPEPIGLLEVHPNLPFGGALDGVEGEGRAQEISADPLETLAVAAVDGDGRVQLHAEAANEHRRGGRSSAERAGKPEEGFYVGTGYDYKIAESSFSVDVDGDGWALLDRVRISPEALRDEALTHWDALKTKVVTALEPGEVFECVYGEYEGDGIPPVCIKRVPLSAEAVKNEVAKIEGKVDAIHAAFETDAQGLHAALLAVAPTDCV